MKRILSLLVAFAAVISMSACGASKETAPETAKQETTTAPATEKAETTEKTTAETTAETTTEVTTTEPAAPVADTAYWDMLCKEYNGKNEDYVMADGVLYARGVKTNALPTDYLKYDSSEKTISVANNLPIRFSDDKLYFIDTDSGGVHSVLKCCDYNGNDINKPYSLWDLYDEQATYYANDFIICDNGEVLLFIGARIYLLSSDFSAVKKISIEIDMGHGKTEVLDNFYKFENPYLYNNKLYLCKRSDNYYYVYDIITGESEALDENTYSFLSKSGSMCGKYLIFNDGIYDIETGEKVSGMSIQPILKYNGGDYTYYDFKGGYQYKAIRNSDKCSEIYKFILPENYKEFAKSEEEYAKNYGELIYTSEQQLESGFPYFINGEYITIKDKAGVFLVNLATGEEVEITVQ